MRENGLKDESPKVVTHFYLEKPLLNCYGCFNPTTEEIHILDKELLFNLIMEHEKVHWERRNSIINRILTFYWKRKLAVLGLIIGVGSPIVILDHLKLIPTFTFYVFLLPFLPIFLSYYEEFMTQREAKKRVGAKSVG